MTKPSANITIRHARRDDAETIAGFNRAMAWETEAHVMDEAISRAGVIGLFDAPHYGFYLLAESSGEVVGSLLVTFEWSDWRNGLIWWIQSVYVRPPWRRQGVYRSLYQQVKHLAAAHGGVRGFRLYVEKNNAVAQRTYTDLGMREADYLLFEDMVSKD